MRQRRDILILITLFVVLSVFTILGPGRSSDEESETRPTTFSGAPTGTLGLFRWLDDLGYDTQRLAYTDFMLDTQMDALVVINPSEPFNQTQTDLVLDWVEAGGTLFLIDDRSRLFGGANRLLNTLHIDIHPTEASIEHVTPLQPVFNDPPLQFIVAGTKQALTSTRNDIVPLIGRPDAFIVVGLKYDQGYIYVSSASFPFTNEGLKHHTQHADLVLNLLRRVPKGGRIVFDEYHLGFFEPPSLRTIILSNPWGWGLLYALIVIVAYLILTGRRFGRPIPLKEEIVQRSSAEYIENMADLFQRGGKRTFILKHYYVSLKRQLARPYGINPQLNDTDFVTELARYRPIDQLMLTQLLVRLHHSDTTEEELLRLITEADSMIAKRSS